MQQSKRPEAVPYIVFQREIARQERHIKRLWIALVVAMLVIALTVGVFVWYLNQYDFTSYDQDGQGVNIIGDMNGVDYNGATAENTNQEKPVHSAGQSDPQT